MISLSCVDGQVYKNISFEIGVNGSRVFNTQEVVSFEKSEIYSFNKINITNESPSYSINHNFSLRYNLTKKHLLGIRLGFNTLGSMLTGDIESFDDTGVQYSVVLENSHNKVQSKSVDIVYEYQFSVSKTNLTLGLGVGRQTNTYYDSYVRVPGISFNNYSAHAAAGMIFPVFKYTSLHTKFFATQSFANNSDHALDASESVYIPLQVGFELGLRFQLNDN